VIVALLSAPLAAQDRMAEMRSRFEHETNPVRRAKLLPDLGEAEFREIRRNVEREKGAEALTLLRAYREQAQQCAEALDKTKVDPERHPGGYKQLQISIQESLRRVDSLLPLLTSDDQAAFVEVRKDLDDMNRHLIEQLFPQRLPATQRPEKPEP